jgi:predicted deacylase
VLVVGGIHGNEPEPLPGVAELASNLGASPPRGTVLLIEDINPDGTASGTRGNARGVDLNRNWSTGNFVATARHGPHPKSEPESALLAEQIAAFAPEVIIVLHSIRSGPFVNFDGPARAHAEVFAGACRPMDPRWTVRASMGYPTPGSLGTWAGVERGIATLTVEFSRGHAAELTRHAVVAGTRAVLEMTATPTRARSKLGP